MRNRPIVVVGMFSFLLLAVPLRSIGETSPSQAAEPAEYIVEDLQGTQTQVLKQGKTQWEQAQEGQVVAAGDEVKVGEKSELTLMLRSETAVRLNENSDLKVGQIETNKTGGLLSRLTVLAGKILSDVKKNLQESHSAFEVESNGVVCGVRGTAFEVESKGDDAQVLTHEGDVSVKDKDKVQDVTAGNVFSFKKGKFTGKRTLTSNEIASFKKWRQHREQIFKKREVRLDAAKKGNSKTLKMTKKPKIKPKKHKPPVKKEIPAQ